MNGKTATEGAPIADQIAALESQLPAAKEALAALERDEGSAKGAQKDLTAASAALPDPTRDLNEREIDTLRKLKAHSANVTARAPASPAPQRAGSEKYHLRQPPLRAGPAMLHVHAGPRRHVARQAREAV
jgi:hypothetical protein